MKANNQFSIAIHILLFLGLFSEKSKITSVEIAESVGCNPVIVRQILGKLKKAGLVTILRAKGGTVLAKSPMSISLWDVYTALEGPLAMDVFKLHPSPNEQCPLGRSIHSLLAVPYKETSQAIRDCLSKFSLQDLMDQYCATDRT